MVARIIVPVGLSAILLLAGLPGLAADENGEEIPTVILSPSDAIEVEVPDENVREVRLVAAQPFQAAWLAPSSLDPGDWGRVIAVIYPTGAFEAAPDGCGGSPEDWGLFATTTGSNIPAEGPEHPPGEYTLLVAAERPSVFRIYFDDPVPGMLAYFTGHTTRPVDTAASAKVATFPRAEVEHDGPAPLTASFEETLTFDRPAIGEAYFSAFPSVGAGTSEMEHRLGNTGGVCGESMQNSVHVGAVVAGVGSVSELPVLLGAGTYTWTGDYESTAGAWDAVFDFNSVGAGSFIQLP